MIVITSSASVDAVAEPHLHVQQAAHALAPGLVLVAQHRQFPEEVPRLQRQGRVAVQVNVTFLHPGLEHLIIISMSTVNALALL